MKFPRDACAARLRDGIAAMGLDLPETTQAALLDYLELMDKWNQAYNLTAIRQPLEMVDKHLLDSLSLLPHVADAPLLDVGAGAGLPGLVLAIVKQNAAPLSLEGRGDGGEGEKSPNEALHPGRLSPSPLPTPLKGEGVFSVTLVDAVAKKVRFMEHVIRTLKLSNAKALHARVETLEGAYAQITSRAFASLADFLNLTRSLLAPGGKWLAMKGQIPHDELRDLPDWAEAIETPRLYAPTLLGERHLIVLSDRERA
ncbi:MAG: 16S rRNA (guanine(527)-N(7))-methyltransferase RsmG [Pseudomonadota bacterium]